MENGWLDVNMQWAGPRNYRQTLKIAKLMTWLERLEIRFDIVPEVAISHLSARGGELLHGVPANLDASSGGEQLAQEQCLK